MALPLVIGLAKRRPEERILLGLQHREPAFDRDFVVREDASVRGSECTRQRRSYVMVIALHACANLVCSLTCYWTPAQTRIACIVFMDKHMSNNNGFGDATALRAV